MNTGILVKTMLALAIVSLGLSTLFVFLKPSTRGQDLPKDSEWTLVVDGSVANTLTLKYEEILAMPKTTVYAELYCVDSPSLVLARGRWSGVKLGLLLERAQVLSEAFKVVFHANDSYSSDLPVATAMREDVIIAYELNSRPLSEKLRLVTPGKWGYKWVSRLARIELVNYDFKGTWESRGYSDEADTPHTLPADLNRDGSVNSQDLRIVVAAFRSKYGNPNWNAIADMDNNGIIDILDVSIIAKSYREAM